MLGKVVIENEEKFLSTADCKYGKQSMSTTSQYSMYET